MDQLPMDIPLGEGLRRLPVYLLMDCSQSMRGEPLEWVSDGVTRLHGELMSDTIARQTAHLAAISFGGTARPLTLGLVPLPQFELPGLTAEGNTPLGAALALVKRSLDEDIKAPEPGAVRGDWRPLVFVWTDGKPTDEWLPPLDSVLSHPRSRPSNLVFIACGAHAKGAFFRDVANPPQVHAFGLNNDEQSYRAFFQWVTESVRWRSRAVTVGGRGDDNQLPEPPPELVQFV